VSLRFEHIINIWANYNSPNQNWTNRNNLIQIWVELETFKNYEHVVVTHNSKQP